MHKITRIPKAKCEKVRLKETKQTTNETTKKKQNKHASKRRTNDQWLPVHAGKGPTTTHRRPHAVGPHVESPGQAEGRGREGRPCFSGQAASVDMGGATVHR